MKDSSSIIRLRHFLILLIVFFPFALILGPFLTDLTLSIIGLIFLFFLFKDRLWSYIKNFYVVIFLIWSAYLIINSLFSENIFLSLESSLFYFRFIFFSLGIWYAIESNFKTIKYFAISLSLVFIILIFDSFLQYFFLYNFLGYEYNGSRLSGLFGEEQILGSFISRLIPLLFGVLIYSFSKNKFIIYFLLLVLILSDILVYLSGERSAFFYLLMSTILMLILIKDFKLIRLFSIFISIFIIIIISFSNNSVKYRMIDHTLNQMNIFKSSQNNVVKSEINTKNNKEVENCNRGVCNFDNSFKFFSIQHHVLYVSAIRMFKDNPLFGIGPKMFREVCKKPKYFIIPKEDVSSSSCRTSPHNTYIQLLSETGIVGSFPIFALFFLNIYIFLKQFIVNYITKEKFLDDFSIFLFISLFISLWPLIPTGNFFNNYISAIYYLPIGFILYRSSVLKKSNNKITNK